MLTALPRTARAVSLRPIAAVAMTATLPTLVTVVRGDENLLSPWVAAAILGGAAWAYAIDDDAAVLLAPSPTTLAVRRALRVAVSALPVFAAWGLVALVSAAAGHFYDVPLAALGVQVLTVTGVAIAVAAYGGGLAGATAAVCTPLLVTALSMKYTWLPRVGDPSQNRRWLIVAAVAWAAACWMCRDPAAPRTRRTGRAFRGVHTG